MFLIYNAPFLQVYNIEGEVIQTINAEGQEEDYFKVGQEPLEEEEEEEKEEDKEAEAKEEDEGGEDEEKEKEEVSDLYIVIKI